MANTYEVKLPLFEGPFDLLLFFIERDELDIYDIPIAKVTADFLDYMHHLEHMNIEVASEFILVASTLMRIKAKLLLPRPQLDEEGNEIDPREELVRHLLEYKKYKSVVQELASMEDAQLNKEKRGNVVQELRSLAEVTQVEAEMQDLDLYKLLRVFEKVMQRHEEEKKRPVHRVVPYPYTMEGQRAYVLDTVRERRRLSFGDLIDLNPDKIVVIFNFLSILELLQMGKLNLTIGEGFNNFWIEPREEPTESPVSVDAD